MKIKIDRLIVYSLFFLVLALMFVLPWKTVRAQESCNEIYLGQADPLTGCSSKSCQGDKHTEGNNCWCTQCAGDGIPGIEGCQQVARDIFTCNGG